jgi:IS5 family transposase
LFEAHHDDVLLCCTLGGPLISGRLRLKLWFGLMIVVLANPAWAEPRTLYTEVFGELRAAEYDLGILERLTATKTIYNAQQWDRTTQALARLGPVWAESRRRLDKASPPKHKELWEKTNRMLALQQDLAMKCAYVVQLEYGPKGSSGSGDKQTLKLARDEVDKLRADYDLARSELSRRL